jgi:hypothetical protein
MVIDCLIHVSFRIMPGEVNDRYEPLPGLSGLPAFVWRRLPRVAKLALIGAAVGAVVLAILLAPGIQRAKEERARAEASESARIQRLELERTRREQRPRVGRGAPAGSNLEARAALVASAAASIRADASERSAAGEFNGPIKRVDCEPYPPRADGVPADQVPSKRFGLYSCLAVTSDIPATSGNRGGALGHPYRARIDFRSGRYGFCKYRGRPGELAVKAERGVPLSPACGG